VTLGEMEERDVPVLVWMPPISWRCDGERHWISSRGESSVSVMVVGWESRPYDGGSWIERLGVLRGQMSKGYSDNEDNR